jgi:hypothetical protein
MLTLPAFYAPVLVTSPRPVQISPCERPFLRHVGMAGIALRRAKAGRLAVHVLRSPRAQAGRKSSRSYRAESEASRTRARAVESTRAVHRLR